MGVAVSCRWHVEGAGLECGRPTSRTAAAATACWGGEHVGEETCLVVQDVVGGRDGLPGGDSCVHLCKNLGAAVGSETEVGRDLEQGVAFLGDGPDAADSDLSITDSD